MPRPFKIVQLLPAKKLAELVRFCREQSRTVDQIHEWTDAAGIDVSRGAVYAWRNRFVVHACHSGGRAVERPLGRFLISRPGSAACVGNRLDVRLSEFQMDYAKEREEAIPFSALADAITGDWSKRNEPVVEWIKEAKVVIAIDANADGGAVVYGRDVLDRVIERAPFFEPELPIVKFAIDFSPRTEELEILCAALIAIKGSHCYRN